MKKKLFTLVSILLITTLSCNKEQEENIQKNELKLISSSKPMLPYKRNNEKWKLTFNDEFNGNSLDETKWNYDTEWKQSANPYVTKLNRRKNQVLVGSGYLYLGTKKVASDALDVSAVNTKGKYGFNFAYFEARVAVQDPVKTSTSSSFWLTTGSLTNSKLRTEIDVFEAANADNRLSSGMSTNDRKIHLGAGYNVKSLGVFNVYGIDWNRDNIAFYCNGKLQHIIYRNKHYPNGDYLEKIPFFTEYINLSTSGNWAGQFEGFKNRKIGDAQFTLVDYIRVYHKPNDDPKYKLTTGELKEILGL